ncbi:PREDICTED: ABC transporter A family member 7-like isoform X2 [Nicotiana attenuata]|uniref:Abc transporter a family member 7 n=1 Tax=Nicotiana attenuata TaxID=49451 RepID=A0A1J6HY08_NICAT|nr:PREDICTED: ABC transporter A family member 7-like isoform X2 [Nicotiana attenuata]OIS97179.1 abc transporter a family member 7 [Nicotiana attenuata]
MADLVHGPASFWTQANALLRKNLIFQKRDVKSNIRLISVPIILCLLLVLIQNLVNKNLDTPSNRCGCKCVDKNGDGKCEQVCGIENSDLGQASNCPIPSPSEWPSLLQIPASKYRAVQTDFISYGDLPDDSCKMSGSCPATILLTGSNQTFGESMGRNLFSSGSTLNSSDIFYSLAYNILGSESHTEYVNFLEAAFFSNLPVYYVQSQCSSNSTFSLPLDFDSVAVQQEISCLKGLHLWRNSSYEINDELYKGYRKGNQEGKINEIITAYDFHNSNMNGFNVNIWYNSTYKKDKGNLPMALSRIPRLVNLASNAYLQFLLGPSARMLFEFVKEMPKAETKLSLDFASILGPLFFSWVVSQLFPVVLIALVYEKQQKLRIMMKMHGLADGPYWMISYAYFLVISSVYMLSFVIFGSLVGLKFFLLNDYSIQFVFYFIYINLQVSLTFLVAAFFSNVKTATVIGYIMVFANGLLAAFLFQFFLQDESFPRGWIIVMELYPGFSLFRGLYEFSQYAFNGNYMGTDGMRWNDLSDGKNGMKEVLIIMLVQWLVLLFLSYYVDQIASSGKDPLFFLWNSRKNPSPSFRKHSLLRQGSKVFVRMEKPDVAQERERVEQLIESSTTHAIICDSLKKVYQGKDGNPEKFAVRGLSLALPQGECFGMLGPNGAGKTTFINMMIGLIKPSSGTAYAQGMDIRTDMDMIYTNMGVCPQHDLLWENLTGREHLLFYGRLKNLKGPDLTQAVEESLKSINLFHGGVADKQAGKYSGGMKRRLSVAISLIGDPKVVYMDEPSTGLDPASRHNLWNVVKRAKQDRAIILTTHSMEEAEHLCDRLGIFVDGSLQCIGNPKELKARYGGSYVFTMTTSSDNEEEVEHMVRRLTPNANKIYHISGTQKFELPKQEVRIADVFQAVEKVKSKFTVYAWGLADTTLEDVFIKVARATQAFNVLS